MTEQRNVSDDDTHVIDCSRVAGGFRIAILNRDDPNDGSWIYATDDGALALAAFLIREVGRTPNDEPPC